MGVLRQGLLEAGEAGRRVMEVRDGLVEAAAGQVGQEGLKGTERSGRRVGLFGRTDDVMPGGPLDEVVATPAIACGIDMPGLAGAGGDEAERASVRVGLAGLLQLGVGVGADALHVGHQLIRSAEDVMVDALEHVAARAAVGLHVHLEGVVDMAAAVGGG